MKTVLSLLCLFVVLCLADNDIYMGGDFLLTLQQDDGNLDHISSLVSYDPDNDEYNDTFEGGVFTSNGYLSLLVEVPMGTYGTGVFTFIDDDHDYSNAVLRYNNDDDDFETVKDGIYLRDGDSVRYIAGTDDHTFFAGNFNSIEYISEDAGEEVYVPNIAKINDDHDWSLLDDPDSVFYLDPYISGLAAFDDTVFILATGQGVQDIFSWDSDNNYQHLNINVTDSTGVPLSLADGIYTDSYGNIGAFTFAGGASGTGPYYFEFFDAQNSYASTQIFLYNTITACSDNPGIPGYPIIKPYLDGFLIAIPSLDDNCNNYEWNFFNSTTAQLQESLTGGITIPSIDEIDYLIPGKDGDLWVATTASSTILYLPFGGAQWIQVDLSAFGTFTVLAMEWDNGPDKLLVYGSTSAAGNQLIEVKTNSFPPMVQQKTPGGLYRSGTVSALAVMNDPDDDDYELYIGGTFDSIGDNHGYSNFVRWKAGSYSSPLPNLPPLNALATSGEVIFYATSECAGNGVQLPVGYYNKDTEDIDIWTTVPTVHASNGCVTALAATDEYIFIGGSFGVLIPPTNYDGYAVIYYDLTSNSWHDIGIPSSIASSLAYYEINTLDVATVDGALYVAIGGHFDFNVGETEYTSFAMYNMDTGLWLSNQGQEFVTDSIVNEVVIDDLESVYISGSLVTPTLTDTGVFSYNVQTNAYSPIGDIPVDVESILLNTVEEDDVDVTYVFAGGNFNNGTQHGGLGYTPSTSGSNVPWTKAATESQFQQYFMGDVHSLLYTTGGVGANDTNGNDPGYTPVYVGPSSSGGMSAWGTVFLILFLLICVVAIVAVIGGGGFVYWKKRQNYQAV